MDIVILSIPEHMLTENTLPFKPNFFIGAYSSRVETEDGKENPMQIKLVERVFQHEVQRFCTVSL